MKTACFDFRANLSAALAKDAQGKSAFEALPEVQALGWHDHLLHCGACRYLLESEQALDELLGSLPTPRLDEGRRVHLLARLGVELRLEKLLNDADPFVSAPQGLTERILAKLAETTSETTSTSSQDHRQPADPVGTGRRTLDQQLASIEDIAPPAGMKERVLAHCQEHGRAPLPKRVTTASPKHSKPRSAAQVTGRKVVLRHWLPTSLVAAGLAAILWYLPGWGKQGALEPLDPIVAKGDDRPDGGDAEFNPSLSPGDPLADSDEELLAMLDELEVLDIVDELGDEEWELLAEYDQLGLFLFADADGNGTEGRSEMGDQPK